MLARAAFVALHFTPLAPRADQFVYTKTLQTGGIIWQAWMSVDGTRPSRVGSHILFGCTHGVMTFPTGSPHSRACTPAPAYFPGMPTTSGAMLSYLERTQGIRPGDLNDLAKTVGDLLDSDYLPPAQQAALYRFLATTPGITVQQGIADTAGRPGIGVGWSFQGSRAMLIFNPSTYTYLGMTTWGLNGQRSGDALLQVGVVNRIGQLPVPSRTVTNSQART